MARETPTIDISGAQLDPRDFARQTDSYVRPATPAPSPLWGVAQALSSFDADLGQWAAKREAKQQEDDGIRGWAAERADPQAWAKAVQDGKAPANASPYFTRGGNQAMGDQMGQDLYRQMELSYNSAPNHENWSYQQFDDWQHQYVADKLQATGNNPDILRGLKPGLDAGVEKLRILHNNNLATSTYNNGVASHIASATSSIDTAENDGLTNGTGTNYDALWSGLMDKRRLAGDSGVKFDDYDGQLVKAILAKAEEKHDPALLDLFKRKLPGSDHALEDDPRYRDDLSGAKDKLMSIALQQEDRTYKLQERQKKDQTDKITSATISAIAKDPTAPIPEDILQAGEKLDPKFRVNMAEYQKTLAEGRPEDKDHLNGVMEQVLNGGGKQAVMNALHNGYISKPETLRTMLEFADKNTDPQFQKIFDSSAVKDGIAAIKTKTTPSGLEAQMGLMGMSEAQLAAITDYKMAIADWASKHKDAGFFEQQEAVNKITKSILDGVNNSAADPANNPITYKRPGSATADNPFAAGVAPPPAPTFDDVRNIVGAGDQQQAAEQNDVRPPVPAPGLDTIPKAARDALETKAQTLGVDPAVLWEGMWQKMDPKLREGFMPNRGTMDHVGSEVAPQGILGVIQKAEAPEGYDSVYHKSPIQPEMPVSQMNMGQVINFQRRMVQAGAKSTPVGGYQFIDKTLSRLVNEMHIPLGAQFDPALQDKMATYLMNEAGLADFKAGRMTTDKFADNLAGIWAGLPLGTGKSAYHGDGLNKATIGRGELLAALSGKALPDAGVPGIATANHVTGANDVATGKPAVQPDSPGDIYGAIPKTDSHGEDQIAKFKEWNPDPVGNEKMMLSGVDPQLKQVVDEVRKTSGLNFVVASGKRTAEQQARAKQWGWSKTSDSKHLDGHAVDLWLLNDKGQVVFDKDKQEQLGTAVNKAFKKLGIKGRSGGAFGDWPHVELN